MRKPSNKEIDKAHADVERIARRTMREIQKVKPRLAFLVIAILVNFMARAFGRTISETYGEVTGALDALPPDERAPMGGNGEEYRRRPLKLQLAIALEGRHMDETAEVMSEAIGRILSQADPSVREKVIEETCAKIARVALSGGIK